MKIIETALQVLNDEIDGINLLKKFFDSNFEDAVKTIFNSNGKVVVTGVGKSGHVGRKISATLSSTGTPSFFINPTEASHGDMGMIEKNDVILAISWSGETTELGDIVRFAHENKNKLIKHLCTSSNVIIELIIYAGCVSKIDSVAKYYVTKLKVSCIEPKSACIMGYHPAV